MNQVLLYIVQFVFQLVTFLFVARFLLQACRADFYNPIAQAVVKITDPVLRPMRLVVPGFRNIDLASLIAAVLAEVLLVVAIFAITDQYLGSWVGLLSHGLISVALFIVRFFQIAIIIVIIASFIAPGTYHPALTLLSQITEPLLAPARRLLPPLGGLDFSPILVFLVLGVIQTFLAQI